MKKRIVFVTVICFLFGIKAFAQCVVSGGDLKDSLKYQTVQQMQDDIKNIKKAAKKDGTSFYVIIPKKSELRNIFLFNKILTEVFDNSEIKIDDYETDSFKYSDEITLTVERRSKSEYCITEIKGLLSRTEVAKIHEKEQEEKRRKQEEEAAERERIIKQINDIKEESEKTFKEKEMLMCRELGFKETTFDSAAEKFTKNKEYILALKAYYEKNSLIMQEQQSFKIKVQDMFQKTKKVYTKWDNKYSSIQPNYSDNKYYNLLKTISSGYPLSNEVEETALYENWKIFIKQFEQYFLENPAFSVYYIDLVKLSEDKKNDSYVYKCGVEADGFFYQDVVNAISQGLWTSWKESWTEIPKNWIKTSPACLLNYEAKFNLVDKNGKVLIEGERFLIGSTKNNAYMYQGRGGIIFNQSKNYFNFKGIPGNVAALIEEGKAFVRLDSLYLKYGPFEEKKEKQIPNSKVLEYKRTKVFNKDKGEFDNIDEIL